MLLLASGHLSRAYLGCAFLFDGQNLGLIRTCDCQVLPFDSSLPWCMVAKLMRKVARRKQQHSTVTYDLDAAQLLPHIFIATCLWINLVLGCFLVNYFPKKNFGSFLKETFRLQKLFGNFPKAKFYQHYYFGSFPKPKFRVWNFAESATFHS